MMHHSPVDLSLAVTWVPGLTCVCKVICLECLLLAVRAHLDTFVGHTLVYLVLHVDRAVTHDLIFDSNTILVWIFLGSVFQTHREQAQSEPPAALLISCASLAWILCCACVLYEPHALRAALSSVRLRLPACTGTSPYPHNLPGKVLASFLTVFGVVVLPITFLGCIYYPWAALAPIKWLQIGVLANPLVYVTEGFRAALTNAPTMSLWAIYPMLVLLTVLFTAIALRNFRKRVIA